jgi:NAD(P)-dependent dehydrogenase (short-subunit alcohol dehydrogenase family)
MSQRPMGKVAIVTGASSGLDRAISLRYVEEGAYLVCADLNPLSRSATRVDAQAAHHLINQKGGRSIIVKVDVSNSESVRGLVQAAVNEFGRVDVSDRPPLAFSPHDTPFY